MASPRTSSTELQAVTVQPDLSATSTVDISFSNVTFTVQDRGTKKEKDILMGVSGCCRSGKLLAIMGPSGAGKSTLLDVLACNSFGGQVKGDILVNGIPRSAPAFKKLSCYVQQRDVLLSSATVREAISTSALLKLPYSIPVEEKRQRVEEVLRDLDLLGCAETLIGDESIGLKGISGGQKRRVSVGMELVKDPAVVFLDEPTSGLDSEMALQVVDSLLQLSRKNRTVVCTIHQPNSDITDMFDDFMLLAGGGVVYAGAWRGAVPFFAANGFECPMYKNPTDYFMSVIKDPDVSGQLTKAFANQQQQLLLQPASAGCATTNVKGAQETDIEAGSDDGSTAAAMATAGTAAAAGAEGGPQCNQGCPSKVAPCTQKGWWGRSNSASSSMFEAFKSSRLWGGEGAPIWFQVLVLARRNIRSWIRNPIMLSSELVQYIFIALFVGLMYCKFDDDYEKGVFNRIACIWFAFAILSFTPAYTSVTIWDKERTLLQRELTQRQYGVTAYYLSRNLVLLPLEMVQCMLFVAIMYFFVGFQADAGKFFLFWATLAMFQMISEGVGFFCGVITKQAMSGIIILTFVMLLILSFSGFLVTSIPVYFRWMNKASFLTYAFSALTMSEFEGLTFVDGTTGELIDGSDAVPDSVDNGLTIAQNVGVVAGWMAGMEIVKYLVLHMAYRLQML